MDEPIVETPAETPPPVVAPVADPVYFGTDGALADGWQGTLPEDIRDEKSLAGFKTVQDLAKSTVMTKKMVGANVIKTLSDTSTPGEIEEWQKAGGRPETAADYDIKMPDDYPEELAAEMFPDGELDKWKERLFKGGASQKFANDIVNDFAKDVLVARQATAQAAEAANAEVVANLTAEYGAAFDQKMHLGDMAVEEFTGGDVEMNEKLAYLRKDPLAVKMLVHFGGMLAEGKPPSFAAIPTPSDYQDQVDTLMADPLYTKGTSAQRMKIANKIQAIKKLQHPEPATV